MSVSLALDFVRAGTKTFVLPGGAISWTQTNLKVDGLLIFLD